MTVTRTLRHVSISRVLGGAQRIAFSGHAPRRATVFGYPAAGRYKTNDRLVGCGPKRVYGFRGLAAVRCSLPQGSSGGPWIAGANRRGFGTVRAVISVGNGKWLLGPSFGPVARRIWHAAERSAT